MAQVSLRNVTKIYSKKIVAIDQINLGVESKEFVVLVGPSGCGKSTTLRIIAGLEEPTYGEIYIGDKLVNNVPAKDRNIAMVFQNYALYPHMTTYENLAFALRLRGYSKQEIDKRVKEAAQILGITHLLDRKPRQLSGGERQRVAVGRAIVRKPLVFLFDEPLSNLDAKMRVQMRTELHRLHQKIQTTMIYVTHDQVEAMTLGDRIAVMRNGKVQQFDTPLNVYEKPVNKFVAGFIGSPSMNFIEGRIIKKDGYLYFDEGEFRVKIPPEKYPSLEKEYIDRKIIFGIRPENIYDKLFASMATPDNTVRAHCEVLETMGSENHVYLSVGRHTIVAVLEADNKPPVGGILEVVFDMQRSLFFDPSTEESIV
ncbi:MAG: sn-glycerol-3-phosphate ABC transporter ATP-binding protein UgpC [Candidatus Omnitrophica bacterium]|nr:sn-glycerol-3-phosphate ABC transporter ATP-binding protein UgpC [Candidatus Omnitrophota bacterium]